VDAHGVEFGGERKHQQNSRLLRIEILRGEVQSGLQLLDRRAVAGDIFFLDPPYRLTSEYRTSMEILGASTLVKNESIVVAEHEKKFDPGERAGGLVRFRIVKQGDTALSFYRKA